MHQAVGSSDAALRERLGEVQAKYRVALAGFAETYDARRHGGTSPGNLLKTNFNLEGLNLPTSSFGKQLLTSLQGLVARCFRVLQGASVPALKPLQSSFQQFLVARGCFKATLKPVYAGLGCQMRHGA